MGIRIHKVIGYGMKNVSEKLDLEKFKKKFIDDHKAYTMNFSEFDRWVYANLELIESLHKGAENYDCKEDMFGYQLFRKGWGSTRGTWAITDYIHYNELERIDQGFILTPLGSENWFRYDDIIDHYEEEKGNRFTPLKRRCGIYPYLDMVPFREPSPELGIPKDLYLEGQGKERKCRKFYPSAYSKLVGWWSKKDPPLVEGKLLEHFLNDYRPIIPLEVSCVVAFFADCMPDPKEFLNSLRPAVYCYWS